MTSSGLPARNERIASASKMRTGPAIVRGPGSSGRGDIAKREDASISATGLAIFRVYVPRAALPPRGNDSS